MISFLQCSAKLSQCYAYVGVALRSALRMGLHRSNPSFSRTFNPIEAETRRRVFWTIRKMDIYVGAMLGLPQTLSEEDIDQEYPLEIDDEYITEEGILPMPEGTTPLTTVFNAHSRLVELLIKIVRNVYPIRAKNVQSNTDRSYTVPFSVIRDIENDLETWKSNLPAGLDPCNNSNPKLTRYVYNSDSLVFNTDHFTGRNNSFVSHTLMLKQCFTDHFCISLRPTSDHITLTNAPTHAQLRT